MMIKRMAYVTVVCFELAGCNSGLTPKFVVNSGGMPDITVEPINSSNLPALNHPLVAHYNGYWLILGGKTAGYHAFSYTYNNPNIYVYNPKTQQIVFERIVNTDLLQPVKDQLNSVAPNSLQDGDTLYMIGGYFNSSLDPSSYTTLQTVSAVNVPGMVNAILHQESNIQQYINFDGSHAEFTNTGGGLGKIGNYFYLAFGQHCEATYCYALQIYTNTIFKFSMDSALNSINIESSISQPDLGNSGFRRRDYSLAPFLLGNNTQTLFALGGPFTQNKTNYVAWTNGIMFAENLNYTNSFINQQANQYKDSTLTIFSQQSNTTYLAAFSGFSNLYWSAESLLFYDKTTPFGNVLDLISYNANTKSVTEYANITPMCSGKPVESCLYMGADTAFIAVENNYDSREILQLDQLSGKTLVGYLYAGLASLQQSGCTTANCYATNQAYAIYVTPHPPTPNNNWLNITNMESGTPYIPN